MHLSTILLLYATNINAFPHLATILKESKGFDTREVNALNAIGLDPLENEKRALDSWDLRKAKRDAIGHKRAALDLPLGGGLLNGVLQPLSGLLQDLDIPTPQPSGLKEIPGDDPKHQFQKPGRTDIRGMCPTLNTLANYGYISRNGITTFAEVANACQTGFGLGYDVSTFLSAFGLLAGGDLLSGKYSIGGQDDRVPNTLGLAPGLDSHGGFEIDTSITRQDTHWGNNANFLIDRWEQYVNTSKQYGGLFNFDMNTDDAHQRYTASRENNPSSLAGLLWLFVSHVERVFVYALLPNGTNQDVADYKNIAPFFLDEKFPPKWYRRATPWNALQNFPSAFAMFFKTGDQLGANVGLNNFIPFDANLTSRTPEDITCFIVMNLLDITPAQLQQPAIAQHPDLFKAFLKGTVWPFFVNDGHYNCPVDEFVGPSPSSGQKGQVYSSSGSPVNGKYDGIGYIRSDGPS